LVEIAPVIANVAAQLGPLATEALRIISVLTGAQGLAATSTLRARQSGGASEIAGLQAEADRLNESRRFADVQEVDRINARIQAIRRTIRDVDAELANRGEFADPRDRRNQASERFRLSGGLAGAPRAFAARPDLTPKKESDAESSVDRALRQLKEQSDLQQTILQTMGMDTATRETMLARQRALNVAARDGETITDEQRRKIDEASEAYGRMAAQIEKAKEAQRQLKELSDFAKGTFTGFFQEIGQGLSQGKNLWDSFAQAGLNALNKIAQKLIEMAAQQLFMSAFGGVGGGGGLLSLLGGGGGGLGAMLGIFPEMAKGGVFANDNLQPFAKGGAFTNSIVTRPTVFPFAKGVGLMGEAGPEAIMPLRRTPDGRLGVAGMGGGTTFAPVTNVTVQGNADQSTVAMLKAELDRRDRAWEAKLPGMVTQARRDRTLKSA
jgi:hypothetical protein